MIKAPTFVKFRLQDQPLVSGLAETLGVSTVLARILVNRGIATSEDANKFLHTDVSALHSPFLLKDMDVAVARIVRAVSVKERICVYGDYDVDGAVATALLMLFFQELGIEIDFYVPNRLTEGYSIHKDSLRPLKENGVTLVITVDNGISAHEAIAHARELGMDVIVTDHHQAPETLPPALAVVNPNRKDCSYPFKGICGAGVAYKLVMALRQRLREQNYFKGRTEPNLKQYLDLVCLATICDVVPLKDENRFFVKEGLKQLGQTRRVGLIALKAIC
ncbi:MAG TPA: DHH family phosphoesterase, partial [bacterium]|nr:DHH family phosphoesterase [bacterium]